MGHVSRNWLMLAAIFALGYGGSLVYIYMKRPEDAASSAVTEAAALGATQDTRAAAGSSNMPTGSELSSTAEISPDIVAKWLAAAVGDDSQARAAAITALAGAPKSQAVPVLKRVLSSGESQVDRPLALQSLHTLAIQQGDADSGIRNVLREAVYHSDDDATTRGAQDVLDSVETHISNSHADTMP